MSDNISNNDGMPDTMDQFSLSTNVAGDHESKLFQKPIPKAGVPVVFPQPPDDWQFNQFINEIADDIGNHDLEKMKYQCSGAGGIQFHVLKEIKTVRSLFRLLKNREFLNRENMVYLQILLKVAGRMDLVEKVINYARSMGNTLYYYPATRKPENGYKYVKMHVEGIDFSNSNMMYIHDLKQRLSMALFVPIQFICIAGIEPSSSLLITFMVPVKYVELMVKRLTNGDRFPDLHSHHIDVIQIGEMAFNITGQVEAQVVVSEQHEKLTSVYQQLDTARQNLGRSELEVVRLSEKIERIQTENKRIRDEMENMRKRLEAIKQLNKKKVEILGKISPRLRFMDRCKLMQKYTWDKTDSSTKEKMNRDGSYFLEGLFYKEIQTKQKVPPFEEFIEFMLADVGRDDLRTEFLELCMVRQPRRKKSADEPVNMPETVEMHQHMIPEHMMPEHMMPVVGSYPQSHTEYFETRDAYGTSQKNSFAQTNPAHA